MILSTLNYFILFSLGINLGIWVCIFARLLKKTDNFGVSDNQPVSIIICSRNASRQLKNNLQVFLDQEYQNNEIVLIDDDSTDESKDVLKLLKSENTKLQYYTIKKTKEGKKEALAYGISKANYEWIALSDVDCKPATTNWLKSMTTKINPAIKIVLGYSPFIKQNGWLNKLIRFECCMNAIQYFSAAASGFPYMGTGRNLLYQKSIFDKEALKLNLPYGDDDLLINAKSTRENTTINLDYDSFVYTEAPSSYKAYFFQKWRHYAASLHYKPVIQFYLSVYFFTLLIFYFCFFYLLTSPYPHIALLSLGLKVIISWPLFNTLSKRLKEEDLVFYFPLLEVLYLIHIILQIPFLFIKKKAW